MIENIKNIEYDQLTNTTGDPFADLGGDVISFLSKKFPDKNIIELIQWITDIYVTKWGGCIHQVFLNHPVTQGAWDSQRKIDETIKYYKSLINDIDSIDGTCQISGRSVKVFKAGRHNSVLTGSGTFINFHPGMSGGLYFTKEILIRMFFVPFGAVRVGRCMIVVRSNIQSINDLYSSASCLKNIDNIDKNKSTEMLTSDFVSVGGFAFDFIDKVINKSLGGNVGISLNIYQFVNFGASPEIKIYNIHPQSFEFYRRMQYVDLKYSWDEFVDSSYHNRSFPVAVYSKKDDAYICKKGGKEIVIERFLFESWFNTVHHFLINGQSLLKLFLNYSKKHRLEFDIVKYYELIYRQ